MLDWQSGFIATHKHDPDRHGWDTAIYIAGIRGVALGESKV